jgi:hypothetical protein
MRSANPQESTFGRKIRFGSPADRTGPTIGKFLEGGPGFNPVVRVPYGRVVHITANVAGILFHLCFSFPVFFLRPFLKA